MTTLYPDLHGPTEATTTTTVTMPASAPAATDVTLPNAAARSLQCGRCDKDVDEGTGHAYLVMACAHRMHAACLSQLVAANSVVPPSVGGPNWCVVCKRERLLAGTFTDLRDTDALVARLNQRHTSDFGRNVMRAIENDTLADAEYNAILGVQPKSSAPGAVRLFSSLLGSVAHTTTSVWTDSSKDDVNDDDDDGGGTGARLEGDALCDELVRRGRTLERIFTSTADIDLAHLHLAGLWERRHLDRLGFDAAINLREQYRRRLPLFLLVDRYDVSWDSDLAQLLPAQVKLFRLRADELSLLGASMPALLAAKWTKADLFALRIRPSLLMQHCDMQASHVTAFGVALEDLHPRHRHNRIWYNDFRDGNSDFSKLFSPAAAK